MKRFLAILSISSLAFACNNEPMITTEFWRGEFQLTDSVSLPINFKVYNDSMVIYNGPERIHITEVERHGDTAVFHLPVFDNAFEVIQSNGTMTGSWVKYDAEDYSIPFTATANDSIRFKYDATPSATLAKRYKVAFRYGKENEKPAIGEFKQLPNGTLYGTFLTETGDYRYLEGKVAGNHFALSSFDGVHAYVFSGIIDKDGNLSGWHHSGKSYAEPFMAWPNDTFQLSNPEELTYLKEGFETVSFSLKSITGDTFEFNPEQYKGKVVIVQLMGSWCPNCMDETRFLALLYNKYHPMGLEVIGISFERYEDFNRAQPAMLKMQRDLNIPYSIVFGGKASPEGISDALPMIDHFMSYPTAITIDKNGLVRSIHTGFSGPGTSVYEEYTTQTEAFIVNLLNE